MEEKNENLKTVLYLILTIIALFIAMCVVDVFVKIPPDSNNDLMLIRGLYSDFLGNNEQAYKDYTYLTNHNYHSSLLHKRKKVVELELNTGKEPNFTPYMETLQKKIKGNWNPPKLSKSKRVKLIFKVSKDGKLLNAKILQSSNDKSTDSAAIDALKKSSPFEPLPKNFTGKSINIEFTFDYNVHDKK